MFGSVDEALKIGLELDSDGYVRRVRVVGSVTRDLDRDINRLTTGNHKLSQSFASVDHGLDSLSGTWSKFASVGTAAVGIITGLDAAILGAGIAASKKAGDFEALERALTAIEGSAESAKRKMLELRDIAKGPGLGVVEAIETYSGLRRGGVDEGLSTSLTRQVGNAVAYTGGGREELGRIAIALSQIAVSPVLRGQDVMQLAQARLPIYQMLKNQFGTGDTEELGRRGITSGEALRALNEELMKLPRIAGGAKNAWDNFMDAADMGVISFGNGINNILIPALNGAADIFSPSNLAQIEAFGTTIATSVKNIFDTMSGGTATVTSVLDQMLLTVIDLGVAQERAAEGFHKVFGWIENIRSSVDEWLNGGPEDRRGIIDFLSKPIDAMTLGGSKWVRDQLLGTSGRPSITQESESRLSGLKSMADVKSGASAGSSLGYADVAASQPAASAATNPTLPILKSIDTNIRDMRDSLRDMILGGGAATRAAFNARNISGWSGGGGSGRGMRKVIEGMEEMMAEQVASLGHGGFLGNASARG